MNVRRIIRCLFLSCAVWIFGDLRAHQSDTDTAALFQERIGSLVAVEFFIQREIDRQPQEAMGLVVDKDGLVVLLEGALPHWLPPRQFKEFKAYLPGEGGDGYEAEYLGQDYLSGWHYLRVEESVWPRLTPVADFPVSEPAIGQEIWGIGLLGEEFDYQPYFLRGGLSVVQKLPQRVGFSETAVAVPGGPVFDLAGNFVGTAGNSMTREQILYAGNDQQRVGLRSIRQSGTFLLAEDFLKYIGRVPRNPEGDPRPWIGVSGLQPIDREVARFLGLEEQGALVASTVIEDSPAFLGGLQDRDIIVAIDGEALPKYRPDAVLQRYFERQILLREPGHTMRLSVVRGELRDEIEIEVGAQPKQLNQAQRRYFGDLGFTVREFVLWDAIGRRIKPNEITGAIASFVRPNSPVNTAGLKRGDWIKEIDGTVVFSYESAHAYLEDIEADESREDFVLLISRNNETSVLRVKLR